MLLVYKFGFIEKCIRNGSKGDSTELMEDWFRLVQEKNQLLRKENELMIQQRELQLQVCEKSPVFIDRYPGNIPDFRPPSPPVQPASFEFWI